LIEQNPQNCFLLATVLPAELDEVGRECSRSPSIHTSALEDDSRLLILVSDFGMRLLDFLLELQEARFADSVSNAVVVHRLFYTNLLFAPRAEN
jgi:hypothetical protein